MAEAIARRDAPDILEACSAGLFPLGFVAGQTLHTLVANGYPTEGLESKPICRHSWDSSDLIINMSGEPKHLAFEDPARVEDWDVEDPYGADPAVYQRIVEDIAIRVNELADRLRKQRRVETPKS
jgi:protein-tyrosine-phosphatase